MVKYNIETLILCTKSYGVMHHKVMSMFFTWSAICWIFTICIKNGRTRNNQNF